MSFRNPFTTSHITSEEETLKIRKALTSIWGQTFQIGRHIINGIIQTGGTGLVATEEAEKLCAALVAHHVGCWFFITVAGEAAEDRVIYYYEREARAGGTVVPAVLVQRYGMTTSR